MKKIAFIIICMFGFAVCSSAAAQSTKVLFFEAALSPTDMIFSSEPAGYAKLMELLRSEGMLIASMSAGEITREKLRPYQIVALHCSPERPLENREVSALVWFVAQEGGTLLVHGGIPRIVNPLIEIFGVTMDASNLVDLSSAMKDDASGHRFTLTQFPKNADLQVENIQKIGFYGGSPLILSKDAASIVSGDEDCYSEDGLYSIGSFPPVAAVAYMGPGVVVVKSDRSMLNNQNLEQYENRQWAKSLFSKLAAARDTSVERDESILGLRSRIHELEGSLQTSGEKIAKYENDLTVGYGKMQELQAQLEASEKDGENLHTQMNAMQSEHEKLNKALSRYKNPSVWKIAAVVVAAILIVTFLAGFTAGRRSFRPRL